MASASSLWSIVVKVMAWPFRPIQENFVFFLFMFVLGYMCTQTEITLHLAGAKPYELSATELFLDLYILCTLLLLIPQKVRHWIRWGIALLLYAIALIDMFCYVRFESTLTPTMLMLASETDGRETSEFFHAYLGWDLLLTGIGWILLILLLHIGWAVTVRFLEKHIDMNRRFKTPLYAVLGLLCLAGIVQAAYNTYDNKSSMLRLFSHDTIGDVEHDLTRSDAANLYLPVYRMAFSLFANHLAGRQLDQLTTARKQITVDSCSHRTPVIVLIIGESYNRHRSQLYGYDKPTSPRQLERAQDSSLVVFTDVVAPWNLTSYVFKHFLSLHAVGDEGDWCDAPLFPEVFRRAGYRVSFFTNQFLAKASEKVYDFSSGFFLNDPELSSALFDERNQQLHDYDEGLLTDYDRTAADTLQPRLVLFHLMGQHIYYETRFPKQRRHFTEADYNRTDLDKRRLNVCADYDNATLYNDSVVDQIIRRFETQDAIVVYMPDHAEECLNPPRPMYGRLHSVKIDRRLAREEFEIPFWIWCSAKNRALHPELYASIVAARHRPFMTDNLPHLLFTLAGLHTKLYRADYDPLSPRYDSQRQRLLKNQVDYDGLGD